MRYDGEHKQKTRARVLKEAARAIRAEGPHRIAVAGVMAKAGLTHGGFYAHFASKEALVTAAIDAMFAEASSRFTRGAVRTDDPGAPSQEGARPKERLTRYLDFYLSADHRDARTTGCPLPALAADLPRLAKASRERYGQGVAALTRLIADALQAMGCAEAEALAHSTLSEMVGALSLARAVADPTQSASILDASRTALKTRLGLETAP